MAINPPPFSLSVQRANGDVTVRVFGEVDMESSPVLKSNLLQLAQSGAQRVTVDLAETAFIDSTGLHALVRVLKELRGNGGDLVVRSPSKSAARLLHLTGFDTFVRVL